MSTEWIATRTRGATVGEALARIGAVIRSAMQAASREIFEAGQLDPGVAGMSTTASVVLVVGELAVIGQVGDTRVYHRRGALIKQLTEDHTLVNMRVREGLVRAEEARGRKSPITRALGLGAEVEVDIFTLPIAAGDRLLLCTDGVHDHLEDEAVLARLFAMEPRDAAVAAIQHANACGGRDNATAVFVEIVEEGGEP